MRFLVSVVNHACVCVHDSDYVQQIGKWLLIYVGVSNDDLTDYAEKIEKFVRKIPEIQFFHHAGRIDASLQDVKGEILVISNFTLFGTADKGKKLSFTHSAPYAEAEKIYDSLVEALCTAGLRIKTGMFGAEMKVESVNDGPINLIFDY